MKLDLDNLEKTYNLIKKEIKEEIIDSFDVVKTVEEYRYFWKPDKIKVLLLAESHVCTTEEEYNKNLNKQELQKLEDFIEEINWNNYPKNYVKFVYCLGYGENKLLSNKIKNNRGTPDYWKIFASCVAEDGNTLEDFFKKLNFKDNDERIKTKIKILKKMKRKGIWLVDASIIGIAGNNALRNVSKKEKIIELTWDNYLEREIEEIIEQNNLCGVIIIGKRVKNILEEKIKCIQKRIWIKNLNFLIEVREKEEEIKGIDGIITEIYMGKGIKIMKIPQPRGWKGNRKKYFDEIQKFCIEFIN